ncbi:hypothetical protein AAF712_015387 [Marasmius tenuissimus]|uniref:Uncharacterized protein n=1 Tax=Marasmius tenuissimus TaxID=585030 RepID=A0ABR2Z6Q7_9AGAR
MLPPSVSLYAQTQSQVTHHMDSKKLPGQGGEQHTSLAAEESISLERVQQLESQLSVLQASHSDHERVQDEHEKQVQELNGEIVRLEGQLQHEEALNREMKEEVVFQNRIFRHQYVLAIRAVSLVIIVMQRVSYTSRPLLTLKVTRCFKAEAEACDARRTENFEAQINDLALEHDREVRGISRRYEEEKKQRDEDVQAQHNTAIKTLREDFYSTLNHIQATHNLELGQLKRRVRGFRALLIFSLAVLCFLFSPL